MKKVTILVLLALGLVGCAPEAEVSTELTNEEAEVVVEKNEDGTETQTEVWEEENEDGVKVEVTSVKVIKDGEVISETEVRTDVIEGEVEEVEGVEEEVEEVEEVEELEELEEVEEEE